MSSDPNASPVNPLPPVVVALAALIFGIEVLFNLGARGLLGGAEAVGWRLSALETYAVPGGLQNWMLETGRFSGDNLIRYVTYSFVHVSFTHMLFVVVFVLALGKMVGEVFRAWAVLAVFFGASIVGAIVYGLLNERAGLIGGYPAVYGLIGAFTFLLWVNLAAHGANKYRAFTLIAFLLGIQLIFGLFFGGGKDWVADVAGFATGFGLSFFVCPGGWSHVMAVLRRR
ncbi:rhomboid family intramembrane serine protease [Pseudohalocynthiibacter aestuariivivens]|jgi:membrane associated rhomboid family serine protease|uniref:Rhomboid family intramembrane serine protease n=1 Tax=Pseudohalocynthiibacter aestuariivivens TaxID=1591409 RepID=A0ABV5JAM2_9RHOB|nr:MULTISPECIES: rhomboid family intramembrane serine protease [Pseudohalocynthiibacter]MBS9715942.1 rhomboid family intramembrane serine protease [Pseudohalocynthiibacter aestuariivivens]MCK0102502.1 rhomboid family intramembrane serine protease [Pseudohalocynthiibacter sp. F2068]